MEPSAVIRETSIAARKLHKFGARCVISNGSPMRRLVTSALLRTMMPPAFPIEMMVSAGYIIQGRSFRLWEVTFSSSSSPSSRRSKTPHAKGFFGGIHGASTGGEKLLLSVLTLSASVEDGLHKRHRLHRGREGVDVLPRV